MLQYASITTGRYTFSILIIRTVTSKHICAGSNLFILTAGVTMFEGIPGLRTFRPGAPIVKSAFVWPGRPLLPGRSWTGLGRICSRPLRPGASRKSHASLGHGSSAIGPESPRSLWKTGPSGPTSSQMEEAQGDCTVPILTSIQWGEMRSHRSCPSLTTLGRTLHLSQFWTMNRNCART